MVEQGDGLPGVVRATGSALAVALPALPPPPQQLNLVDACAGTVVPASKP